MQCGCRYDVEHDEYIEICSRHESDLCMDCEKHQREFDEYYMVHDNIWESAVIGDELFGLLCIGCLEDRLGRQLNPRDFTSFPVNSKENAKKHSWRQQWRMGYFN